ncbi:MAG: hypothetical protein V3T23_06365 [Nitrososphaerales archaeon]
MQLTNPIDFIKFGGHVRYLIGGREDYPIGGDRYLLAILLEVQRYITELGFIVSSKLFEATLSPYLDNFAENLAADENATLGEIADQFCSAVMNFERTVDAEALTIPIALPVPRRIPLNHLLEEPDKILGTKVFDSLTPIAQEYFRQAGRCIAFECPTAAAFHVLRCTEECLRVLHKAYFPRIKIEKQTWWDLVEKLRKKPKGPKPDPTLLEHLDHLRVRFRNPTDHPDKTYEIEEAEGLLHVAVDAIDRCIKDPKVQTRLESK